LRELAKTCNFCNNACTEAAIRDQIIEGLCDQEIVQELLKERNLTLTKAIDLAQGLEAAKLHKKGPRPAVNKVSASGSKGKGRNDTKKGTSGHDPPKKDTCGSCGRPKHTGSQKCPASGKTCSSCGGRNHFQQVCRSKDNSTKKQGGGTNGSSTKVAAISTQPKKVGRERGEMFRPVRIGAI